MRVFEIRIRTATLDRLECLYCCVQQMRFEQSRRSQRYPMTCTTHLHANAMIIYFLFRQTALPPYTLLSWHRLKCFYSLLDVSSQLISQYAVLHHNQRELVSKSVCTCFGTAPGFQHRRIGPRLI